MTENYVHLSVIVQVFGSSPSGSISCEQDLKRGILATFPRVSTGHRWQVPRFLPETGLLVTERPWSPFHIGASRTSSFASVNTHHRDYQSHSLQSDGEFRNFGHPSLKETRHRQAPPETGLLVRIITEMPWSPFHPELVPSLPSTLAIEIIEVIRFCSVIFSRI
jgi:hypothetical protein